MVVCNWPGQQARGPASAVSVRHGSAHVEGFRPMNKGGPTSRWLVGLSFYLDDVEPGGGGTYYWPRSHQAVHRYYKRW